MRETEPPYSNYTDSDLCRKNSDINDPSDI